MEQSAWRVAGIAGRGRRRSSPGIWRKFVREVDTVAEHERGAGNAEHAAACRNKSAIWSKFFYEGKLQSPDDESTIAIRESRRLSGIRGCSFAKPTGGQIAMTTAIANAAKSMQRGGCRGNFASDKLKGRADVAIIAAYCGQVICYGGSKKNTVGSRSRIFLWTIAIPVRKYCRRISGARKRHCYL